MVSRNAGKLRQHLLIVLLLLFYYSAFTTDVYADDFPMISKQRRIELHNLLIQDCGSCHGMTMKGGLGPALTPEVLKNKSRQMIEVAILQGRPGTPMPPWNILLSKDEVRWLVDTLYSGITP